MALKKINIPDKNLQLIQANVDEAISPLQSLPMVGGNVLPGVVVNTSQTSIPHKLNHIPRYWAILDVNGQAMIARTSTSDNKYIYLTASAAVTVTLWVN